MEVDGAGERCVGAKDANIYFRSDESHIVSMEIIGCIGI